MVFPTKSLQLVVTSDMKRWGRQLSNTACSCIYKYMYRSIYPCLSLQFNIILKKKNDSRKINLKKNLNHVAELVLLMKMKSRDRKRADVGIFSG